MSSVAPYWEPDPEVERWLEWALEIIGPESWRERRAAVERFAKDIESRQTVELSGDFTESVTPPDRAAWYLYQAELYLRQPLLYDMPLSTRIIPTMKVLGHRLDRLKLVPFSNERLRHGLVVARDEVDSVLFELLVASAYAAQGWDDVAFIPRDPNGLPSPDLKVRHRGRTAFVECKRKRAISDYARQERAQWWRLSKAVRSALVERRLGIVLDCVFHVPLTSLPADYLERRVLPLLDLAVPGCLIDDDEMTLSMRSVNLREVQRNLETNIMRQDGTGLSRDLFGFTDLWKGITSTLLARPLLHAPRYVDDIEWAAASIWGCDSPESMRRKAQHFRRELAEAVGQLPRGETAFVHIGAEAYDGEGVEAVRYRRLTDEMMTEFDSDGRDLEVTYCHIFRSEIPFDENWAVEEDAHFWLREASSERYLLRPPGLLNHPEATRKGRRVL